MKNFIQPGVNVTVPAPVGGAVSGTPYLIGSLFGIASATVDAGADLSLVTEGVFQVTKVSAQAWTLGQRVYWDDTAKNFTTTVGSNTLVGVAVAAAANPSATGIVRLNASF